MEQSAFRQTSAARQHRPCQRLRGLGVLVAALTSILPLLASAQTPDRDAAIRTLAPLSELWVVVSADCAACAGQVDLAREVGSRYGFRVAVVPLDDPRLPEMPAALQRLLAMMGPMLKPKVPVVLIAVPRMPALFPVASSASLPANAAELADRMSAVGEMALAPNQEARPWDWSTR